MGLWLTDSEAYLKGPLIGGKNKAWSFAPGYLAQRRYWTFYDAIKFVGKQSGYGVTYQ